MTNTTCDTNTGGLSVEERTANSKSIQITGLTELVRGHDQALLDHLEPLVCREDLTLDLHSVERIDAAGITALIFLYRSACEADHYFTVSNASPHVAEILALVGLDRILLSQNGTHPAHCNPIARLGLRQSAA
jgi:anti-anti-sigma regulatory factor